VRGGKIIYAGPRGKLPKGLRARREVSGAGMSAIPAFIDAHTHLPFLGDRRDEFLRRLAGESYLQIAQAGGGIVRSVGAVRAATQGGIEAAVARRLRVFREFGVLTVEAKSGYGLDPESELKQLRALQRFRAGGAGAEALGVEVVPTFMGAHALPREFRERRAAYVDLVIHGMLPAVAGEKLAEYCDIFCEQTAFTKSETTRIAAAAKKLSLRVKIHVDELTAGGGAGLAARLRAVSAEHLIHADGAGMKAMARAGTVAVLLPGTSFFLGEPYAPARRFVAAGVPVAVATDFNPGSAHSENLQNVMMLALQHSKLSPEEILTAVTLNGAAALDRAGSLGSLEPGKQADFLLLGTDDWRDLFYHWGVNPVKKRFKLGISH
jgi:imidazolonepropionase